MKDILRDYTELFRKQRKNMKRYTAMLLVLALSTTLFVNWQLHGIGISMTAEYQCGMEEHEHTAACYEKVLTCGYVEGEPEDWNVTPTPDDVRIDAGFGVDAEESEPEMVEQIETQMVAEPHVHTDACYEERKVLNCLEEEHVHDDDCFDPETNELICDKFEHTHDESCYTTERELVCGLEEGELVETPVDVVVWVPVEKEKPAAVQTYEAPQAQPVATAPTHVHTDACYTEVLVCNKPEHHHTVECLSDPMEDVESEEDWLAKTDTTLTGEWGKDLVTVAKSQIGYQESLKNFHLDTDDGETVRGYSRYGAWYGNKYGEWDVMFLSYCLHYANIPSTVIPQRAGVNALRADMLNSDLLSDLLVEADGMAAMPGDVVIYNNVVTETVAKDETYDDTFSDSTADVDPNPDDPYGIALYSGNDSRPVVVDDSDLQIGKTGTVDTETRQVAIETVGIVTEVDENAGTLTVISGDVNGQVAEVQVNASDVTDVILVNAAYYAYAEKDVDDSFDGQMICRVTKVEGVDPSQYYRFGIAVYADEQTTVQAGSVDLKKHIKTIKIEVPASTNSAGEVTSWKDADGVVNPDQTVKVSLTYAFSDGEINQNCRTTTYQLPDNVRFPDDLHGGDVTLNGQKVGTYTVNESGLVTIVYDESFATGKAFEGDFEFTATVTKDSSAVGGTIDFGGTNGTVVIKKKDVASDLSISKDLQRDENNQNMISKDSAGKLDIGYSVIASTTNGSGNTITLTDQIDQANSSTGGTISYDTSTIQLIKIDQNGNKVDVTKQYEDKLTVSDAGGIVYKDLPELAEGEKYQLLYHVKTPLNADGTYKVANGAKAEYDGKTTTTSKTVENTTPRVQKSGYYSLDDRTITWTIRINNPFKEDLSNKTVTDLLPKGYEVIDYVRVTREHWSKEEDYPSISAEDFKKAGYTYTFPNRTEDGSFYTIVIKTKLPDDAKVGDTVTNEATFDGTSGSGNVTITDRDAKVEKSRASVSDYGEGKKKLEWNSSTTVPSEWKSVNMTDTILDAVAGGIDQADTHYAILSELDKELRSNVRLDVHNGTTVTTENASTYGVAFAFKYYDADGNELNVAATPNAHVKKFSITATLADGKTLDARKLYVNGYHTIADVSEAQVDEEWYFRNEVTNGELNGSADYTYVKRNELKFEKVAGSNTTNYGQGATVRYEDGNIYYKLIIPASLGTGDIDVTDLLPVGTTYNDDAAAMVYIKTLDEINQAGAINYAYNWSNESWGNHGDCYKFDEQNHFTVTSSKETVDGAERTKLSFHIVDGYNPKNEPLKVLCISYSVKVNDGELWDDLKTENQYTNSAEWKGKTVSTTTTVTRTYEKLYKKGVTVDDTANGPTKKVHYSVVINPKAEKLLETSNTLTLEDTFKMEPYNSANSAQLDLTSIHLYGVTQENGEFVADPSVEIGRERYTVSYDPANYKMTVTVPDGLACVLEYDYYISYPSSTTITLKNTANLSGKWSKEDSTEANNYNSGATVKYSDFTLYKVDSHDYLLQLPGAEFELSKWNPQTHKFEKLTTLTTDAAGGKLHFELLDATAKKETWTGSEAKLLDDTLYRLVETKAPDGYAVSKQPMYLLWGESTTTKKSEAFKAANESTDGGFNDPDYNNWVDANQNTVKYFPRGESGAAYVENELTTLKVVKRWLDKDGKTEIANKDVDSSYTATVELWRHVKKWGTDSHDELYETKTLDKDNDWTYSWNELPVKETRDYTEYSYTYYVKETDNAGEFKYVLNNGGITGGTITLYNQVPVSDGFELPSTGGTGTTPFTAVGGAMALAALVCGACRKRRRERRSD